MTRENRFRWASKENVLHIPAKDVSPTRIPQAAATDKEVRSPTHACSGSLTAARPSRSSNS